MSSCDVLERPGQEHSEGGTPSGLIPSKLRCPPVRRGTIRRSSLIERLRRDDARPIVSVVAPAGYGKTTLLSQWAERSGQAVAWVSVDDRDNDPKVLLSYVATVPGCAVPGGASMRGSENCQRARELGLLER